MIPSRPSWPALLAVLLSCLLPTALGLKFDLQAHPGNQAKYQRCIRNFVGRDTLVVVTATVSGTQGDGQVVNMHVSLAHSNIPERISRLSPCTD